MFVSTLICGRSLELPTLHNPSHHHTQTCTVLFSFYEQQITDEGLITICRGCHRLQSLCVSGCANITDAILHALGQNCPRLR